MNKHDIIVFMDNATSHSAAYTIYHLNEAGVRVVFNCANSPGLNLIEFVFQDLKDIVRKSNKSKYKEII